MDRPQATHVAIVSRGGTVDSATDGRSILLPPPIYNFFDRSPILGQTLLRDNQLNVLTLKSVSLTLKGVRNDTKVLDM